MLNSTKLAPIAAIMQNLSVLSLSILFLVLNSTVLGYTKTLKLHQYAATNKVSTNYKNRQTIQLNRSMEV